MPHYVTVQLVPTDQEMLARYFEVGGAAVRKHGGVAIAGGPDKAVIEDNGGGPPVSVLLTFPNAESANAWINDPELADIHQLRRSGSKTTITLLPPM